MAETTMKGLREVLKNGVIDVQQLRRNTIHFTFEPSSAPGQVILMTVQRDPVTSKQVNPRLNTGSCSLRDGGFPIRKDDIPYEVWRSVYRRARYLFRLIPL